PTGGREAQAPQSTSFTGDGHVLGRAANPADRLGDEVPIGAARLKYFEKQPVGEQPAPPGTGGEVQAPQSVSSTVDGSLVPPAVTSSRPETPVPPGGGGEPGTPSVSSTEEGHQVVQADT